MSTALDRLALYRACPRIEPLPALDPLRGMITICANDHIRVIPRNSMSRTFGRQVVLWRHDPDEIRALAQGGKK